VDDLVQVRCDSPLNPEQLQQLEALIRRMLSYDQDLSAFYALLRDQPRFAWVEAKGAGRMLIGATVWEDLAKTLLTTNTTWTMTRQMVSRLVTLGEAYRDGNAFPTAQQIAAMSPEALNTHVRAGYRGAYLHELAENIASGAVDVESWYGSDLPSAELYRQIRGLKGFGDYAAGSLMRLLGRHDQLGIDSVAREMFRVRFNSGQKAPDVAIRAHYEGFGSWRGLALWMDVIAEE
jgi:N-glycosylase/DNA lyase